MTKLENRRVFKNIPLCKEPECFHVIENLRSEEISIYQVDEGAKCDSINNYKTNFLCIADSKEAVAQLYMKHLRARYAHEEKNGATRGSIGRPIDGRMPTMQAVMEKITLSTNIRAYMNRRLVCCAECKHIDIVEKFIKPRAGKEGVIANLENKYGMYWYSVVGSNNVYFDREKYFENVLDTNRDSRHRISSLDCNNYESGNTSFSPLLICPKCGCKLNKYKFQGLNTQNRFANSNIRMKAITVFDDEEKVAVAAMCKSYYINTKAVKFSVKNFHFKVVFNLKTGQTYYVGPNKKGTKGATSLYFPRIVCLTYQRPYNPPQLLQDLLGNVEMKKEVFRLLVRNYGGTPKNFSDLPKKFDIEALLLDNPFPDMCLSAKDSPAKEETVEKDWIDDIDFMDVPYLFLTFYNRLPGLNSSQLNRLIAEDTSFMSNLFAKVKNTDTSEEILSKVLKNARVADKGKKIKKMIAADLMFGHYARIFTGLGFKDINIINRFLELPTDRLVSFLEIVKVKNNHKYLKIFIRDMIKHKGESKTFNSLFGDKYYINYIRDTASMYVKFKENDMVSSEYFTDSIKKIHDRMSLDYPKIKYKNINIPYKKDAEKFNVTISEEYEFNLAKDTNELVKIGQDLKICVGSYRDGALNGDFIIISMKQNGKYIGCIELDGKGNYLRQAKAVCNNLLQENKAKALKTWIDMFEIDANDCYDYQHIKEDRIEFDPEKIYTSKSDYHQFELDDAGEVRERGARTFD